jgi:hypothetical protein
VEALNLIEHRLDEGQDVQIRCSIQAYRKAFTETGDDDALNRMLKVLEQPNCSKDEPATNAR